MAQTVGVRAVFDTKQFNAGLKTYVNGMTVAQNVTVNVTKDVNNLNTAFNAGLGAAVGTAAIGAINAIGNAVRQLGSEVISLISRFENLGFTIRSLIAADLVNQGIAGDLADGLERAETLAPALQSQLEQIAILSKFDSFEVSSFFQKALIGSFSLNDALVVTQDLIDFGAAQGRTPLQLDNILREIGQINIAGKVTGENLRTLRNNSFGLANIINRALKGTNKEFEDIKKNGPEVLTLLFSQLEKEVGGSAERIAGSFVGLLSSLRDIQQISLANLFTPLGESVRPQLQELVDLLSSPDFKASLVVIGELLGSVVAEGLQRLTAFVGGAVKAWQDLDPVVKQNIIVFVAAGAAFTVLIGGAAALAIAISALVNPFTVAVAALSLFVVGLTDGFQAAQRITARTVSAIADYFNDLVSAAAEWGINIGQAFADGMVQAANIVVQAVNVIGNAISYLMSPGSPPRFLPDIDTWGTETANVYLQGWTQADFSILDQVGSSIQSFLNGIAQSDLLDEVDVPRLVLGSRQAFAQAISDIQEFGSVTEATLQQIQDNAGPAADVVTSFALRFAEVAVSTEAVAQSQEDLNRITQTYSNLLNPLRDKLQDVSNASADAQDQQKILSLQRILANRGASDARKQAAQLEIQEILTKQQVRNLEQQQTAAEEVAQTQIDAAVEAQTLAEQELALFQSRISAQNTTINLQNDQVRLLEEQAKALESASISAGSLAKSLKKVLTPLQKGLKLLQLQKAEIQDNIKEAKARAVLADDNATAAQKAVAQLQLQEIALRRQQRLLEARELGFSDEDILKLRKVEVVLADIERAKKAAKAGDGAGIFGDLDLGGAGIDTGLLDDFTKKLEETRQKFADIKQQVIDTAATINEKLPDFLKLFPDQEGGEPPIITNLKKYAPVIAGIGAAFATAKIIVAFRNLAGALGLLRLASVGIPAIITGVRIALGLLTGPVGIVIALVSGLAFAWQTNLGGIRDDTIDFVVKTKEQFNFLKDGLTQVFSENGIGGVFEVFKNGIRIVLNSVISIISQKLTLFSNFIKLPSVLAKFLTAGKEIGSNIINGIVASITSGYDAVKTAVTGAIDFVFSGELLETAKTKAKSLGKSITDGISSGITSAQEAANKALSTVTFGLLGQAEKDAQIKSPSRLFADRIGKPIGEGIAQGISEADTGGGIFTFITKIVTAFAGLVLSVLTSTALLVAPVSAVFTLLGANITLATNTMVLAVNTAYQLMSDTINTTIELMATALKIKFDQLKIAIEFITIAMRNAVLFQYQLMDVQVNEAVATFATNVTAKIKALTAAIVELFKEMREGINEEIKTMRTEVLAELGSAGLLGDIKDLDEDYRDAGKALGKALLKGVRDGVRDSQTIEQIISAIDGLATKIENSLKDAFNISSPSKLTETEIGAPIVEGIAAGMRNQIGAVVAAAQDIAAQTINTLQSATAQVSPQTSAFVPGNSSSTSNTNNFNLNVSSQSSSQGIINDFTIMEVLATV